MQSPTTTWCLLLLTCSCVYICCSDNDRKYKYVSVQNFINAFANTDTAKRTQGKLAAPVVINEKAEDPLVRLASSAAFTVFGTGLAIGPELVPCCS